MGRPVARYGARPAHSDGLLLYPGVQEPGSAISVGINKGVWESFDVGERLIQAVAASEYARSLAEFNTNNALSLERLRNEGTVKILKLDDSILKAYREISTDVVAEFGSGDELSKRIYASYQQFLGLIKGWSDIAEGAVLLSRRLA
jgi:TRAP-type mannitol/chloroaromatic compound transport system substrate-binding protein